MPEPFQDFSRALAGDAGAALGHLRAPGGAAPAERLEIHRRNRRQALVDAIAARHPVAEALVGAEFFRALAAEYVRQHPPRSPALLEYGDGLASFLDGFPPARAVACLPDVARLETAWHAAFHAREAPPLHLRALASLAPDTLLEARFEAHPATRLVASAHPIGSLWRAHRDAGTASRLDGYVAECALVVRPQATVEVHVLPSGDRPFLQALLSGARFDVAATAGSASDPVTLLRQLIEVGALTRISAPPGEHSSC